MAVGPIPWDAIDRYAERHGFEGDDYEDLVDFVRAMDEVFLASEREKAKKKPGGE